MHLFVLYRLAMHLTATLVLQGSVQAALFVGWRLLFQALVRLDSRQLGRERERERERER